MNELKTIEDIKFEINLINRKISEFEKLESYNERVEHFCKFQICINHSVLLMIDLEEATALSEKIDGMRNLLYSRDIISFLEKIDCEYEFYKTHESYRYC